MRTFSVRPPTGGFFISRDSPGESERGTLHGFQDAPEDLLAALEISSEILFVGIGDFHPKVRNIGLQGVDEYLFLLTGKIDLQHGGLLAGRVANEIAPFLRDHVASIAELISQGLLALRGVEKFIRFISDSRPYALDA
jgi:hypothetical protein